MRIGGLKVFQEAPHFAGGELVDPEGLDGQFHQRRLLFGKHGGHLALGGAVNARVGPVVFPAVEVGLSVFEALEAQALQRRVLGMSDASYDSVFDQAGVLRGGADPRELRRRKQLVVIVYTLEIDRQIRLLLNRVLDQAANTDQDGQDCDRSD